MFGFLKRGNDPKSRTNTEETSEDSATPSSTNRGHSRQTSEGPTPRSSLANHPPPHPNNASFPLSQPAAASTAHTIHPSHEPPSDPAASQPYPPSNNNQHTLPFKIQQHQLNPTVRWVLADDILAQRYAPPLTHLQGQWQPLTTAIASSSSSTESDAWPYLHCQYMSIPTSSNTINNSNSGGDSYQHQQQQQHTDSKNKSTTSHTLPVWQSFMLGKNSAAFVPRGSGGGRGWGYSGGGGSNNNAASSQLRGTRPRQLFQYKPYIQQAPLELTEMEITAVITAVLGPIDSASNSVFQKNGGSIRNNDDALERELWGGEAAGGGGVNNNNRSNQQQQQRKKLNAHAPAGEAAAVILIKLIIDTYLRSGPGAAFPQILAMFQEALIKNAPSAKKRIFDVLFNLSIHGELLYSSAGGFGRGGGNGGGGGDDLPYASAAEMAAAEASLLGNGGNADMSNMNWHATVTSAFRTTLAASLSTPGGGGVYKSDRNNNSNIPRIRVAPDQQRQQQHDYLPPGSGDNTPTHGAFSEWPPLKPKDLPPFAINTEIKLQTERFRQWLRLILFRLIALLPDLEEEEEEEKEGQGQAGNTGAKGGGGGVDEATWIAAFSSLVHLSTHQGKVVRGYVDQLPLHGVAGLLQAARKYCWDEHVQSWLIRLAMNLLYMPPDPANTATTSCTGGGGGGDKQQQHRKRSSSSGGESLRAMTSQLLQQQTSWAAGGGGLAVGGLPSSSSSSSTSSSSFWGSASINRKRLADFGGLPAVIACYKTAPTAAARKNAFSVLFDLAVCGEDALSLITTTDPLLSFSSTTTHHHKGPPPPLIPRAHLSEVAALGSAFFQLGLDQHIQPLFTAGLTGIIPHLAGPLSVRMAAMQEMNPGRVVAVAPQFVVDVLDCLDDMIGVYVSVPAELDVAVQHTLQSIVTSGGTDDTTVSLVEAGWECLEDCFIGKSSTFSSSIACNWLQKLLIVQAEMQVLSLANNKQGKSGDFSKAAACLILLPDFVTTSQNIKNTGTSRLSKMISTLLGTTSSSTRAKSDSDGKGGRGAVYFAQAVAGLLAYIQLRCSGLERIGEDSPSPLGKRQTHYSTIGTTTPLITPLTTTSSITSSPAAAAAVPSPLLDSPSLVFEDGGTISITLTSPLGGGNASASSIASSEAWRLVNGGKSMIATLCEAVRWLEGQGRGRGKGSALFSVSKTLLDMVSIPVDVVNDIENNLTAERQQQQMGATSTASMHQQQQQQEGDTRMMTTRKKPSLSVQIPGGDGSGTNNNTTTALTPLSAAIKNSARRSSLMGTPVAGGTGLGLGPAGTTGNAQWFSPASEAASTPYQTPAQSFSSSIFKFPVPIAPTAADATTTSNNINRTSFGGSGNASPGMVTPRTRLTVGGGGGINTTSANNSPFLSISNLITGGGGGGGNTSAAATPQQQALNYATTTGRAITQQQQQQQPGAPHVGGSTTNSMIPSSDEHTVLEGFLLGSRVIPISMLHSIPIAILKVLFSEMDMVLKQATPPTSGQSSALAVNTCQPVWDVRLALLLVLMARCIKPTTNKSDSTRCNGVSDDEAETVFFSSLLDDTDGRVRQYASVFVLRRLMQRQPVKYREALRFVGIRAQQAGEERLVCSPWLQLKAMLEHRLVDFQA